jgi:transposase-like protein
MARRTRRLWTDEEKRSICLQTTAPGVSVAQVALRYTVNANLIFKWLRDRKYRPGAGSEEPGLRFAADHRWMQSLMPTRFLAMAPVLTKEGWHPLDPQQTATLLRARPDPDDKNRIQGRMQKLLAPAAGVSSQHVNAIDADLKDLRTKDLRQVIKAWTARKQVIEAEGETLAQGFRNRAAARARVDNQSMVNALRGQVEADERRATLAVLMAQTRIKLTVAAIAAAIQSHPA